MPYFISVAYNAILEKLPPASIYERGRLHLEVREKGGDAPRPSPAARYILRFRAPIFYHIYALYATKEGEQHGRKKKRGGLAGKVWPLADQGAI